MTSPGRTIPHHGREYELQGKARPKTSILKYDLKNPVKGRCVRLQNMENNGSRKHVHHQITETAERPKPSQPLLERYNW
jgi:hypothetical protein